MWQADRWTDEVKEPCHLFQIEMYLSLVCVCVCVTVCVCLYDSSFFKHKHARTRARAHTHTSQKLSFNTEESVSSADEVNTEEKGRVTRSLGGDQ